MKKLLGVTFEDVASVENFCEAWQEFIRGKRKKKDVQEFAMNLGDEIVALHDELMSGGYQHGSYHHFAINDSKPRDIHKATVRDRLLHHAIHRKLYSFFSDMFISDSFSCQTGKGMHRAINRFRSMARKVSRNHTRTCWVLKCDIRKFFASIDHRILLAILEQQIEDRRLLDLLGRVVGSFEFSTGKGLPLGNLTSQLLANVYMNKLDQFVKQILRVKWYIRYADDFVFLSEDRNALVAHLSAVESFLSSRLLLRLHPDKVTIETVAYGVDFLGWVHFPNHRVLRTKTKRRMMNRIRKHPNNETLQSYRGLLDHGNAFELQEKMKNGYWLFG